MKSTNQQLVALSLILAITCLIYWPGLQGPLLFDDNYNLAPINDWLNGLRGWASVVFGNDSGILGRPVAMASFVLNTRLLGPDVWHFKLVNLLLHVGNGALVYILFRRIALDGGLLARQTPASAWIAVLGASIWLLHPLLVSTVLYVVQRMAILSATFTLITMIAYLYGRLRIAQGRSAWPWFLLAFAATALASLSKENGALAPAMCALLELFLFAPRKDQRRQIASTAFIAAALALPALVAILLTLTKNNLIVEGYTNRPFSLEDRLLTQPRVLWDYIGSILLPHGPGLGLYHDDYRISRSLLDPPSTVFAIAGWVATLAIAWRARTKIPGASLGLGLFLVGHALESTIFPLLMYFEHRNYLPAAGAIWAALSLLTFAAQSVYPRMNHGTAIFGAASVGLLAVLSLATAARARIWISQESIISQSLQYHPHSRWLRMDAAAWALRQTPPLPDIARQHVDHLSNSQDAETRRMGAAARLIIDCTTESRMHPISLRSAFGGQVNAIEADLLLTFERLADTVMAKPCRGLTPLLLADSFDHMLNKTSVPNRSFHVRRLRFKAAHLYLQSGREVDALRQARLAYDGADIDAPVAALIAELELRRGNYATAGKVLDAAEGMIAPDDHVGQKVIATLRGKIQSANNAPMNSVQPLRNADK